MRVLLAVLLLLLLGGASLGCSDAFLSLITFRSHHAFTEESYEGYRETRRAGPVTKADVLTTLGPPIQVLVQDEGDVFVYRRVARDTRIIHLNPSFVSYFGPMPPVPLYFGSFTVGRNDELMVFFDRDGRLREDAVRFEINREREAP